MKKILSLLLIFNLYFFYAQTNLTASENYIYSKTCLNEDCTKKTESVQYFDGLGRMKQEVAIKATPSGKDIATPIEYDSYGRQVKSYLPIPQSGTQNGGIYTNPLSNATTIYGNEKIYSEKILEASPLGRVTQQKQSGNDWDNHPTYISYSSNKDGEVKKYEVTTTWIEGRTNSVLSLSGSYPAAQLYKTKVTDEDGHIKIEFKNKKGQVLLARKNDGTKDIDTYYVYNEYGHQAFVISPLASASGLTDQTTLDNLCYQYRYDGWNRLVEKKLPGKGWEYMVYDKQDRLVLSQDASLRGTSNSFGKKGWTFTKYDQIGRVTYTGFFANTSTRASMQTALNNMSANAANNEKRTTTFFTSNGIDVYYTKDAFPTGSMTVMTINYFDTYPVGTPSIPSQIRGQNVLPQDAQNYAVNTKTLPTASFIKNIDNDSWTKNFSWYDTKGRVIGTYSVNHLGGYTRTESKLDFVGVTQENYTYHKRTASDNEIAIKEIFEYDVQNRLKKHWHQVNGNSQELLTDNTYNELSQLTNKKIGGGLQSNDYAYNIHGSLIKINDPANLNGKLFGYEIKYQNPTNTSDASAKFNGTITEVDWRTASDNILRRYSYQYDTLDRLLKGTYSEPSASIPQNGSFNETQTYDSNGNIITLKRNAPQGSPTPALIDNLSYTYYGNQLIRVQDGTGNASGYPTGGNTISYDSNGNMTNHIDKGISSIQYNYLNLPKQVVMSQSSVTYLYRADGVKLRKTTASLSVDYLNGFQYEGGVMKVLVTSEGYYDFVKNRYIYNQTDHLGNVRLSYSSADGGGIEIIEENNYYPFGLKHQGYNNIEGNPSYKYQYNGKELQTETGWSDFGARMYMADLGRWGVIDPLAETSRRWSPYNYVYDNPINFIDPDGRLTYDWDSGVYRDDHGNEVDNGSAMDYIMSHASVAFRVEFIGVNKNDGGGGNAGSVYLGGGLSDGYMPLTKAIFAQYILGRAAEPGADQGIVGYAFEKAFIDWGSMNNIGRSFRKNGKNIGNTVPDAVEAVAYSLEFVLDGFNSRIITISTGAFFEVKCTDATIGKGTAQVSMEIDALRSQNLKMGVPDDGYIGRLSIATPYFTSLSSPLIAYAESKNIELFQYHAVYKMNGGQMWVKFFTDWDIVKESLGIGKGGGIAVPVFR